MDGDAVTSRESVSVVIPVYNGEKFLGDAIASLLRQTVRVQDIVVIDDGSTDRTPQMPSFAPYQIAWYALMPPPFSRKTSRQARM